MKLSDDELRVLYVALGQYRKVLETDDPRDLEEEEKVQVLSERIWDAAGLPKGGAS